jgi:hypothetical protein
MSNKLTSGVSINLPNSIQQAIKLIAALTGEDERKLGKLPPEELITILCKLLEYEKDKVANLLESHDQNQELDFISLAHLWKLVKKRVVPNKKQKFGTVPDKVFEEFLIHNYKRTNDARYRTDNKLGAGTSSYLTSIPPQSVKPAISVSQLSPIMHRINHALAVNSNKPGFSRTAS